MSATSTRMNSVSNVASPSVTRAAIGAALVAGAVTGFVLGVREAPVMDTELLRLLRAMAVLKLAFVALAAGAVLWRLQAPIRPIWLAAYASVCFAIAVGPSLIWFSSHLIVASVLLHAGLVATLVLLWRDGTAADLLHAAVLRRRVLLRG